MPAAKGATFAAWAAGASPAALAVIILAACLLVVGSWRVYSNTWDEPEHLAAGVELLDRGIYEYDTEHPPLGRVLIALGPWLAGAHSFGTPPPDGTQEGIDILYAGGHYWRTLTLARLGTLPFLVLLLVTTWLWARRIFATPAAALLPVVLLVAVPPVLGHAALASLDVAAAATILLALYMLQRWLLSGTPRDAAFFGLASGVAVGTKFSGVPFIGLSLAALAVVRWLIARKEPPSGSAAAVARPAAGSPAQWIGGLAVAAVTTLLMLFLIYAPRAAHHPGVDFRFHWAVSYLLQKPGLDHAIGVLLTHVQLPYEFQDLVNGVVAVKAHNDTGHLSYLLGAVRSTGWWYFYLVALAVKTPIPLLVGGTIGLIWLARDGWRQAQGWAVAPLVLFATILVFASSFSRINIGIRHILVLYPLLALGSADVLLHAWRATLARGGRTGAVAAVALLALVGWQLSPVWTAFPDYLPYFNEAVANPEHVLVDSDLDWGQDLLRLEQRAAQLQIGKLNLAYRGTADLAREPLPPFHILPPKQPVRGWVAVSALARTRNPADYAWLDAYRPLERVGKTIDLYYIP
ncbi:MAG TPA: phospholipid carrier-dependent glycosyltransferase [Steroidobacteraceae bacterium]|nr:phospholipid carrier-dependent glycosyltransferase [Steroidobacteraceae bacterium]